MNTSLLKNKYFSYNFLNLIFLRFVSRILPLVMQGYILRSAGVLSFGGLGFAKSIGYCFTAIIGYGSYFAVPKYIAFLKQDEDYKKNIGELLTSRILMQLILSLFCFGLFLILTAIIPQIKAVGHFLFFFLLVAISSAMFPIGFFQGINKMYVVSILNPITKAIIYICIPIFIKTPDDAIIYPMIFAIAEFIRLILAFLILNLCFKIPIVFPSIQIIKQQLKDGWTTFCFDFYLLFYSHFPTIFLGILVNREAVAVYRIGDRLAQFVRDLLEPFLQCLYPIISKLFKENLNEGFALAKKVISGNFILMLPLCFCCYFFSDNIISLFCGGSVKEDFFITANEVLKIHSFLPFLVTTSSILGLQVLTPLKKGFFYSIILFFTGFLAMSLHFNLVPRYGSIGAAYAILLGEVVTFLCVFILTVYYKKRLTKQNGFVA